MNEEAFDFSKKNTDKEIKQQMIREEIEKRSFSTAIVHILGLLQLLKQDVLCREFEIDTMLGLLTKCLA